MYEQAVVCMKEILKQHWIPAFAGMTKKDGMTENYVNLSFNDVFT
jgi:hypothetical protein